MASSSYALDPAACFDIAPRVLREIALRDLRELERQRDVVVRKIAALDYLLSAVTRYRLEGVEGFEAVFGG